MPRKYGLSTPMKKELALMWRGLPVEAVMYRTRIGLTGRGYMADGKLTPKAHEWAKAEGLTDDDKRCPEHLMFESLPAEQLRAVIAVVERDQARKVSANFPALKTKGILAKVGRTYDLTPRYAAEWDEWRNNHQDEITRKLRGERAARPNQVIAKPEAPTKLSLRQLLGGDYWVAAQRLKPGELQYIKNYFSFHYGHKQRPDLELERSTRNEIIVYINACMDDVPAFRGAA